MNRPRAVDFIDTDRPSAPVESLDYDTYNDSESEREIQAPTHRNEQNEETLASGAISKGKPMKCLSTPQLTFRRRGGLLD